MESTATISESPDTFSSFDPNTMRTTKPGLKRLILTFSILISFFLGLPFLLKSVEIYRAPLPFHEMDSIESTHLSFPCKFQVMLLGLDYATETSSKLGFSIQESMKKLTGTSSVCGSCSENYTVSITIDSSETLDDSVKNDHVFDELLKGKLEGSGNVYSVVVVSSDEEIRAVVGRFRHAWIIGRVSEVDLAGMIAEILVKIFVNGGKDDGAIHGEFMPVGADGRVVLSFSLLNANPEHWIYDWDFKNVDEMFLTPLVKALYPIANVSVESQVLYHTPKSYFSYWDDKLESYIFNTKDLPFFVNSNEWHLDTSISAGGRSKILHFVVYVPSADECPLLLQLPNGETSGTNGFISPVIHFALFLIQACYMCIIVLKMPNDFPFRSWYSADVGRCYYMESSKLFERFRKSFQTYNFPSALCLHILKQDLKNIFEVFMGQFRQLFGLKSDSIFMGLSGSYKLLTSESGFADWELDLLSRQHTCFNLGSCATTLGSLSRLVQSLPRMIIMDEIGKEVKFSLEAAKLAHENASLGIYEASAGVSSSFTQAFGLSSRQARVLAEDAFYHPSIMSVSYYSFEHCFAVYSPFFLPVAVHVLLAAVRELRRYKRERAKYLAWKAKANVAAQVQQS
ncbi:Phosphatidylinositol-glycan biosynthesis class S protein [Dillenia turbinata]|uniref:Phosphatidylinositol-glycan biosynthesis class S protein n=1 Tax=Dillenia turbinata TaxID=194707 RepID=A0AAN8Z9Y9_9MAGN